jgi:hypothetical protein
MSRLEIEGVMSRLAIYWHINLFTNIEH